MKYVGRGQIAYPKSEDVNVIEPLGNQVGPLTHLMFWLKNKTASFLVDRRITSQMFLTKKIK